MLLNSVLLCLFAMDGVINENVFELGCFVFITICSTYFISYQFFNEDSKRTTEVPVLWLRFIFSCIFTPANIVLSVLVYKQFGWKMYKKIGADIKKIKMYRTYQQTVSLLKLEIQLGLNVVLVVVMFLFQGMDILLDIAACALTVIWALFGWYCIRSEKKKLFIAFLLMCVIQPIYLAVKLSQFHNASEAKEPVISVIGILSIICRVLSIIWCIRCRMQFGQGLKEVLETTTEEESPILITA